MAQPHPKGPVDLTDVEWQSSSVEKEGSRVEIAFRDGFVAMRDGADPDGPILLFTPEEWDAFVDGAKDGEFDL